ncbi:MAG: hypothetical protein M1G31_34305 [Pseudanabaena sp. Salubria-1]|jgi:hypothetical protein|nr:hypothetical protein [Pseudanabaena sp. Salubria-1]
MKFFKKTLTGLLFSTFYGASFGVITAGCDFLITGNDKASAAFVIWSSISSSMVVALALLIDVILQALKYLVVDLDVFKDRFWRNLLTVILFLAFVLSYFLNRLDFFSFALLAGHLVEMSRRKRSTFEQLIDDHITWMIYTPKMVISSTLDWFSDTSISKQIQSKTNVKTLEEHLIVDFTQELTSVFPEDWDEWQQWISDMMEDRKKMQSKGMNHRLVSLITFYRLTRFVWHIGIDKVFMLATRRATR